MVVVVVVQVVQMVPLLSEALFPQGVGCTTPTPALAFRVPVPLTSRSSGYE